MHFRREDRLEKMKKSVKSQDGWQLSRDLNLHLLNADNVTGARPCFSFLFCPQAI
jgi:hypothetical protein